MELCSREALLIGGIYSGLSVPFLFVQTELSEQIMVWLFAAFLVSALMLYVVRFSGFVGKFFQVCPRVAYYIVSIGWIPFVEMIGVFVVLLLTVVCEWSGETIERAAVVFSLLSYLGIPLSLITAYFREKLSD